MLLGVFEPVWLYSVVALPSALKNPGNNCAWPLTV